MATHDVLSDAGETLARIIGVGLDGIVSEPNVVLTTTGEMRNFAPQDPAVTLFLYDISSNPELRNAPPTPGFSRPRLALDLRYLVTPWATDAGTVHQICGHILQTLYDHAHLTRGDLVGISWGADDTMQILLESIPVADHHYIWEPAEIPYKLSLVYLARIIGIDPGSPDSTGIVATATTGGPG